MDEAFYAFAKRIGDRKREREAAGLPPEPAPTREQNLAALKASLMKPNALLSRLQERA